MAKNFFFQFGLLVLLGMNLSCGKKKKPADPGPPMSPTENYFHESSEEFNVWNKGLVAISYLESNVSAVPASSRYELIESPKMIETAFGLTYEGLRVGEDSHMKEQVDAYARLLSEQTHDLRLEKNPATPQDKFNWIWAMASIQVPESHLKNVRVILAKELIQLLNSGFTWKDPESGQEIVVPKEDPPIAIEKLQQDSKNLLRLSTRGAQVFSAELLPFIRSETGETMVPKGLEITHCPFSLSMCLRIQNMDKYKDFLGAHYVIPSDNSVTDLPLQILRHESPLSLINGKGEEEVTDRVVIMLTGKSGWLVNGLRQKVIPTWLSKWQMQSLGELATDICHKIVFDHNATDLEKCLSLKTDGIKLRQNGRNGLSLWGDVPDLDRSLFLSYLQNAGMIEGETVFEFPSQTRRYTKGEAIPFDLKFQKQVTSIQLERLIRCSDQNIVWETLETRSIRALSSYNFTHSFWDGGPNRDGEHFLRAKVYGKDGELLGWDIASLHITDFEPASSLKPKACF